VTDRLPLILGIDAPLRRPGIDLRAGDGEERLLRQAEHEIAEGIAREQTGAEGKVAVIVRGLEEHQRVVAHFADIHAESQRVLVHYFAHVVGDLRGLGDGGPGTVLPDLREFAIAERERRESAGVGVLADIDALQTKLRNRARALDRKCIVLLESREPHAEFIQQRGCNGIAVGNQQTAILIVR